MSHRAFPQVASNNLVTISNGLQVVAGGAAVGAGLVISSGSLSVLTGDARWNTGALSVSSSSATSGLDVFATSTSFTGTLISGRLETGVTTGNVLQLANAAVTMFQVLWACPPCLALGDYLRLPPHTSCAGCRKWPHHSGRGR